MSQIYRHLGHVSSGGRCVRTIRAIMAEDQNRLPAK